MSKSVSHSGSQSVSQLDS